MRVIFKRAHVHGPWHFQGRLRISRKCWLQRVLNLNVFLSFGRIRKKKWLSTVSVEFSLIFENEVDVCFCETIFWCTKVNAFIPRPYYASSWKRQKWSMEMARIYIIARSCRCDQIPRHAIIWIVAASTFHFCRCDEDARMAVGLDVSYSATALRSK